VDLIVFVALTVWMTALAVGATATETAHPTPTATQSVFPLPFLASASHFPVCQCFLLASCWVERKLGHRHRHLRSHHHQARALELLLDYVALLLIWVSINIPYKRLGLLTALILYGIIWAICLFLTCTSGIMDGASTG
jgi:hypothetical protein